jgi:ATP-dependent exoDNAse (exonuclease V) alpha subunit
MDLSPDQISALDQIMEWWKSRTSFISLGGFAGCGKTTLMSVFRSKLPSHVRIAFCSYTGKAASVLKSKLQKIGINLYPSDYVGTIHKLIYEPIKDEDTDIDDVEWKLKDHLDYDLFVVDEASMLGESIYQDLCSFNIPILAVGDHGQLPPIEGSFNLMENPIIRLERVHRFAEGNPLTKISMLARLEGYIPHGKYGDNVIKVSQKHSLVTDFINNSNNFSDSAILCGFNQTRVNVNQKIRSWYKKEGPIPLPGEKVICLKNNAQAKLCPIYNGITGIIRECTTRCDHLYAKIAIDGEDKKYIGKISKNVFNNKNPDMSEWIMEEVSIRSGDSDDIDIDRFLSKKKSKQKRLYLDCFDFGYCLTVHKSQGSEWDRVMLLEQPCQHWSGPLWNRWLYTGVTRSKNELLIVR